MDNKTEIIELVMLRESARRLGFDVEADQLFLAKNAEELSRLVASKQRPGKLARCRLTPDQVEEGVRTGRYSNIEYVRYMWEWRNSVPRLSNLYEKYEGTPLEKWLTSEEIDSTN